MADIQKRVGPRGTTYKVRWRIEGRANYRSFKTMKEARHFVLHELGEIIAGEDEARADTTIGQALELWLDVCEKVGRHGREPVSAGTLRKYVERVDNHLKPLIGDVRLSDFTSVKAVEFRDDLLARCGRPTAAKCVADLKGALAEARTRGLLVHDPLADIKIVDSGRRQRRLVIPTREQMQTLEAAMRAMRDHRNGTIRAAWVRYYPFMQVLRWTGMRPEEARALTASDLRASKGQIRVERAVDERGVIGAVKTAAGVRSIDVPAELFVTLAELVEMKGEGLLFGTGEGKAESHGNITNRAWYPLLKTAKLEGEFDLYSLRHYRISERLAAGENIIKVSRQAGHADSGFTLRTYGHVLEDGLD